MRHEDADFGSYDAIAAAFLPVHAQGLRLSAYAAWQSGEGRAALEICWNSIRGDKLGARCCSTCWSAWGATMTTDIDETPPKDWQGNELNCADCAHAPCRDWRLPATACLRTGPLCAAHRPVLPLEPGVGQGLCRPSLFRSARRGRQTCGCVPPAVAARRPGCDRALERRGAPAAPLPVAPARRPDREVRIRVAVRLEGTDLVLMLEDSDYYVRQTVARYITASCCCR